MKQGNQPPKSRVDSNYKAGDYKAGDNPGGSKSPNNSETGLNAVQQQFVLRFCRQLASVIQACEHSESAEIEVGRRQIGARNIKVKLRSERET